VVVIITTDLFISECVPNLGIQSRDHMNNNSSWSEYSVLVGQIEPHRGRKLLVEDWPSIGTHIGFDLMLSTRCYWPSGIKKYIKIKKEVHSAAFSVKKYSQISVQLLRGRSLRSGKQPRDRNFEFIWCTSCAISTDRIFKYWVTF